MNLPPPIDRSNFLFRLSLLTRRWRHVMDTEIQTSGLTDATWRPLLHLRFLGDGTRQKDLAESLGLKGPSIVRLLDTLLEKGLINRQEDSRDRRAKLLHLTPKGRQLVDQIKEKVVFFEREPLCFLNDEEFLQFTEIIEQIETNVKDLSQGR